MGSDILRWRVYLILVISYMLVFFHRTAQVRRGFRADAVVQDIGCRARETHCRNISAEMR